ncbi:MAG: DotU family type IV/VI secretion system protein [Chthoniobacterales bacterium]|nr:DotU family type IV/VI secretion system protein [Chthoniobacterales bacterium]MCX7713611.1 DotU family type IV/VI secretion system protein [Chthoniobacterales bacterium]
MKTILAAEPLFNRICEWIEKSHSPSSLSLSYDDARREILLLLDQVRNNFLEDPEIANQWTQVEMPLIFFVDSIISESKLPFADEWNHQRLAYDYRELAGDEKFFDILERNLHEPTASANERLLLLYTCLGLGFTGLYGSEPSPIRLKMAEISRRILPGLKTDAHTRLCPEAYENTDTSDLTEPPPISGSTLLLTFLCLTLLATSVLYFFYELSTAPLRNSIASILHQAGSTTSISFPFFSLEKR